MCVRRTCARAEHMRAESNTFADMSAHYPFLLILLGKEIEIIIFDPFLALPHSSLNVICSIVITESQFIVGFAGFVLNGKID